MEYVISGLILIAFIIWIVCFPYYCENFTWLNECGFKNLTLFDKVSKIIGESTYLSIILVMFIFFTILLKEMVFG